MNVVVARCWDYYYYHYFTIYGAIPSAIKEIKHFFDYYCDVLGNPHKVGFYWYKCQAKIQDLPQRFDCAGENIKMFQVLLF